MQIEKSASGLSVVLSSGVFTYSDFSSMAGKVELWKMAKHFESGRAAFNMMKLMPTTASSRHSLFVRYQVIEILPGFNETASISTPWRMECGLGCLGKTSYWLESTMHCQKTSKPLALSRCQAVRVSVATRRPVSIPDDCHIAEYRSKLSGREPPSVIQFPADVPDGRHSFSLSFKAVPSETDRNQHVNQSVCLKYCLDCASVAAVQEGFLQGFNRDMAYYDLKLFAVEYVGEMNVGDMINVVGWENQEPWILHFVVKVGERITCRCLGVWYTDGTGKPVQSRRNVMLDAML